MLLDISKYGFVASLKKGAKVLGYHVFSAAIVAGLAAFAEFIGKLQITHPEYAVYVAAAIASVNVISVIIKNWLQAIDPEKVVMVPAVPAAPVIDPTALDANGIGG